MKKIISILLVLIMTVGQTGYAASSPSVLKSTLKPAATTAVATVVSKEGVVTQFTDKTLTLNENGKMSVYQLDGKSAVTSMGMAVEFSEVIMKGLLVKLKARGTTIVSIEVPGTGQQTQGVPTPFMITEVRENTTDDAILPVNTATMTYARTEAGVLPATDFKMSADGKSLIIGAFVVVEDSLQLKIGDQVIRFVKGEFDNKILGDEAKFTFVKDSASITLETALTADQQKQVSLSYNKKNFNLKAIENTYYLPSENLVAELNGKPASLQKVLNRSNFAYVTTNMQGEVVYLNAFYNDLEAKFIKADKGIIYFAVERNGEVAFTDMLKLDPGATVMDQNGTWTNYTKIKAGTTIALTVDPGMDYAITYLQTK